MTPSATAAASLWSPIAAQISRAPQRIALRADSGEVTYAELGARVAACAAALGEHGAKAGDVIALAAERSAQTICALLAIVARGAAYLPLDPAHSDAWLAAMIEDAQPRLAMGAGRLRTRLPQLAWCDDAPAASSIHIEPSVGELAYVLFTSGSTGRPKGVAMRSRAVARLLDWHAQHARLGRAARTLQFAPLSFDVSFQEIFSTLGTGGTLILPSDAQRRDPWALLELIERERIERVFVPYVALQGLAEAAARVGVPACLRDLVTAGEQLRITPAIRALFAAVPDAVLHNHYGPTEAHVVTAHELAGEAAAWPELPPIGMPLPHVEVRIVADDAPDGEGELLLGGDCLAAGYVGRPELTAERFIDQDGTRWYHTGDRVRRAADGEIHYLGRRDTQIKIAGYRIEPAEIEAVLCRHDAVAEAAVVAEDSATGKVLIAHVVPRDIHADEAALGTLLREHCRQQLAHYMLPQAFVAHTVLPQTSSGKVDRGALARLRADSTIAWPEDANIEVQLRALWQQLLGVDTIGVDTIGVSSNLFDLGATSLMVVHALTELRQRGHVLSVAQVYEHPSIAAQARLLGQTQVTGLGAAAARDRGERQRTALARFARPGGAR